MNGEWSQPRRAPEGRQMNSPGCEPGVWEEKNSSTSLPKAKAQAQPSRQRDSLRESQRHDSIHAATLCVSARAFGREERFIDSSGFPGLKPWAIFFRPSGASPNNVVLNWFEELKAKVPVGK